MKDYASRTSSVPDSSSKMGFCIIVLIVLVVCCAGVFIYHHQSKLSHVKTENQVALKTINLVAKKDKKILGKSVNKDMVVAKSGINFDFYTMLPKMNVQQGQRSLISAPKNYYMVYISSSRSLESMRQLKQHLALLGIAAKISPFYKSGKRWYRLSSGPYVALNQAQSDIERLHQMGVSALISHL